MNEQLKVIISAEVAKFKQNVDNAKKQIKDFVKEGTKDFGSLNDEFQKIGDKSKQALGVMAGATVGAATALLALGESTKEYRQQQAMLTTAFKTAGGSAEDAKQTYNDLYRVLGDSGQATEAAQHLAKLTTEEKALSEWTNICQGVYATFGSSLPIESLTEAVNHSAKLGEVQGTLADALEWSGISVDEFNEQLFWCNSESEREKLIRNTLNGLYSEAADGYETNNAAILAQNEAQAKLTEAMAKLGEVTAPIMTMLTELGAEILADLMPYIEEFANNHLSTVKEALSGVGEAIGNVISWIADNWELVSTLATIILGIAAALSVVSTVMAVVNAVTAASPVTWIVLGIVAAIAALVAIVVVLVKHWDEIKEATRVVWEPMVNFFKIIWEGIVGIFQEAWEIIKIIWDVVKPYFEGIWNAIKIVFSTVKDVIGGFFKAAWENVKIVWGVATNYFTTLINNIKLIFSAVRKVLSGDFKGAWEDIKKIFSNWGSFFTGLWNSVKKIFTNVGQAIGNAVSSTVKGAVNAVLSTAASIINGFIKAINIAISAINLIPGVNIKKLALLNIPQLERGGVLKKGQVGLLEGNGAEAVVPLEKNTEWLDKIAQRLLDGLGGRDTPIILQVDGTTFAKTSINAINKLTRQQGKLGLNLL